MKAHQVAILCSAVQVSFWWLISLIYTLWLRPLSGRPASILSLPCARTVSSLPWCSICLRERKGATKPSECSTTKIGGQCRCTWAFNGAGIFAPTFRSAIYWDLSQRILQLRQATCLLDQRSQKSPKLDSNKCMFCKEEGQHRRIPSMLQRKWHSRISMYNSRRNNCP